MACARFLIFIALMLGAPHAFAQRAPCSSNYGWCSDEGAAFSAGRSQAVASYNDLWKNSYIKETRTCPAGTGANYCQVSFQTGSDAAHLNGPGPYVRYWMLADTCASRPDWNGPYPYLTGGIPKNGSVTCNAGCKQAWYSTGDGYFNGKYSSVPGTCESYDDAKCKNEFGSGYFWNSGMSSCEPEAGKCKDGATPNSQGQCKPEPCPEGKVQNADGTCENKKNECPAGNVKAPSGECLPGDGQCAAGEAKGKDGTCKRDSNGDGKPDSEEGDDDPNKDSASGGENCSSPPTCNGNPVMCLQLRTQWRIDCNTRRDRNVTGGSCGAMPVCVGKDCDATEHAQLIQQWKSACALEKLANKSGDGDGDGSQPEWTKVGGMNQNPGAGELGSDAPVLHERSFSTDDLDQSGFGGGGTCIGLASVSGNGVVGSSYAQVFASPPPMWCDYIAKLRASLIVIASAVACFIIAKGM